jgi:adenosine deaminase
VRDFIDGLPLAELHMHLEGALEPELMLTLARRNGVALAWTSVEEIRAAYRFSGLQSFLDLYFAGCGVLAGEQDFYDLTRDYLTRADADGIVRAEVFLGPQSFTERGIGVREVLDGILRAFDDAAAETGIGGGLIVSTHRHRSEADALALLDSVLPWADRILGIGMGGPEVGNPPSKFARFFHACKENGLRTTVHAGEEGPAAYVREAVEILDVDRIDHGNAALTDAGLTALLAERAVPLTVCPLSNLMLGVVPSMAAHPLRAMLDAGLNVSVHSDDPGYFGGGAKENLACTQEALDLSVDELIVLARNSFRSSWASDIERDRLAGLLNGYLEPAVPTG